MSPQPIFHLLGKTYCWILLSNPPSPTTSSPLLLFYHITNWPSFALPWSCSTWEWIFNVRKADLSRWPLKKKKKKNENKTPSIFQLAWLMVCSLCVPTVRKPNSGRPLNMHTLIWTHGSMHRCRHTICVFMSCCAVFAQAAWSIGDLKSLSKGNPPYCDLQLGPRSSDGGWVTDEGADENVFDEERVGLRNVRPQLVLTVRV